VNVKTEPIRVQAPGENIGRMDRTGRETPLYKLNDQLQGLACLRCETACDVGDPVVDLGRGCPSCLSQGYPASLRLVYDAGQAWEIRDHAQGMMRYIERLPFQCYPSLGEGETPQLPLPSLAERMGVTKVWLKNEGQNPTGSHKDRMSALAVARAASLGRSTVVAASSGNAGASLAAYAVAAGLDCKIIATSKISPLRPGSACRHVSWLQGTAVDRGHQPRQCIGFIDTPSSPRSGCMQCRTML
jgi:hypothetical protein